MKRLFVMRHGNSDLQEGLSDHKRRLNLRGRQEANKMAQKILEQGWKIDLAIVSDATRTTETWAVMERVLRQDMTSIEVLFEPRFYLTGLGTIQDILATQEVRNVLILGHNPGWSAIVYHLSNRAIELQTANLVLLEHHSDSWNEAIHDPQWTMVRFLTPNSLI